MTIHTRFTTSELTLLGRCVDGGGVHIRYAHNGNEDAVPLYELRAGGGLPEITGRIGDLPVVDCDHRDNELFDFA